MKLNEWLEKNEAERKVVVTDPVSLVNKAIRKRNKKGNFVKELETVTPFLLAKEFVLGCQALGFLKEKRKELSSAEAVFYLHNLFLEKKGEAGFLSADSLSVKTSEEVLRIMNIYREGKKNEVSSYTEKQERVLEFIAEYEEKLKKDGLLDKVGFLREASNLLKEDRWEKDGEFWLSMIMNFSKKPQLAVDEFAERRFSFLEKEFLSLFFEKLHLSSEKITLLDDEGCSLRFVRAHGQFNEVDFCIKDIEKRRLHPGDVALYYTNESYEALLAAAFEKEKIGLTFHQIQAGEEEIVNLLLTLVDSLMADYSYEILGGFTKSRLVTEKYLVSKTEDEGSFEEAETGKEETEKESEKEEDFKDKPYSIRYAYKRLLRREDIGSSKKRYQDFLKRHSENNPFSTLSEEENEKMVYFKEFLSDYISVIDEEQEINENFERILLFVKKYTKRFQKKNTILAKLKEELRGIKLLKESTKENQLTILREAILSLEYGEPEDMAKVRAERLTNRSLSERPINYFIGLSSHFVLKGTASSPVLADEELEKLLDKEAGFLPLAKEENLEWKEKLSFLTASFENEATFIYSDFDTVNFSELSPSLIYLENCDKEEIYSYQPLKESYLFRTLPEEEFKETLGNEKGEDGSFSNEKEATACNQEGFFEKEFLSASALEDMLKCPLIFYYKRVESIYLKHDKKYGVWLEANQKGSFFHRVMELYCNKIFKTSGEETAAWKPFDENVFQESFQFALRETKIRVPYPSLEALTIESDEIERVAKNYIVNLHESFTEAAKRGMIWRVIGSELSFGSKTSFFVDYEASDSQVAFSWEGSIDRLDGFLDENNVLVLRIIDYKTGKYENLVKDIEGKKKTNYFIPGGKKVQHYVYAIAGMEYVRQNLDLLKKNFGKDIKGVALYQVVYDFPFEGKAYLAMEEGKQENLKRKGDNPLEYELLFPENIKELLHPIMSAKIVGNVDDLIQKAESYITENLKMEKEQNYRDEDKKCLKCDYRKICRKYI